MEGEEEEAEGVPRGMGGVVLADTAALFDSSVDLSLAIS